MNPEPSAWLLFVLGMAATGLAVRHKFSAADASGKAKNLDKQAGLRSPFGSMSFHRKARALFLLLLGASLFPKKSHAEESGGFGSEKNSGEAALIGIFYDLKQNQKNVRLPVNTPQYCATIDEFLASNWDEAVLNKYYRATRSLYTIQIFIPNIAATAGPAAFGVEKLVVPNYYLVHYKGQVAPPKPGTYRFVGYGDNVLNVAINGKTVLVGNRRDIVLPRHKISPDDGAWVMERGDSRLRRGEWISFKEGEIADLDVIIGESSGGHSCYFLMIEEQGKVYPKDKDGKPILPIFQVAGHKNEANSKAPAFSEGAPWRCFQ